MLLFYQNNNYPNFIKLFITLIAINILSILYAKGSKSSIFKNSYSESCTSKVNVIV